MDGSAFLDILEEPTGLGKPQKIQQECTTPRATNVKKNYQIQSIQQTGKRKVTDIGRKIPFQFLVSCELTVTICQRPENYRD
ncbi:hypothetical protein QE152_g26817 [Popillia japonica]|uniref:Uncharacterized protein n=1 Tax=Popillia japonica TaxID=7064 RepID=A0AAW1JWP9_POPJA